MSGILKENIQFGLPGQLL